MLTMNNSNKFSFQLAILKTFIPSNFIPQASIYDEQGKSTTPFRDSYTGRIVEESVAIRHFDKATREKILSETKKFISEIAYLVYGRDPTLPKASLKVEHKLINENYTSDIRDNKTFELYDIFVEGKKIVLDDAIQILEFRESLHSFLGDLYDHVVVLWNPCLFDSFKFFHLELGNIIRQKLEVSAKKKVKFADEVILTCKQWLHKHFFVQKEEWAEKKETFKGLLITSLDGGRYLIPCSDIEEFARRYCIGLKKGEKLCLQQIIQKNDRIQFYHELDGGSEAQHKKIISYTYHLIREHDWIIRMNKCEELKIEHEIMKNSLDPTHAKIYFWLTYVEGPYEGKRLPLLVTKAEAQKIGELCRERYPSFKDKKGNHIVDINYAGNRLIGSIKVKDKRYVRSKYVPEGFNFEEETVLEYLPVHPWEEDNRKKYRWLNYLPFEEEEPDEGTEYEEKEEADLEDLKDFVSQLVLDCIDKDKANEYMEWSKICWIMKGFEDKDNLWAYEVFDQFSEYGSSYNEAENRKIFDGMKGCKYPLATLRKAAKIDNPSKYENLNDAFIQKQIESGKMKKLDDVTKRIRQLQYAMKEKYNDISIHKGKFEAVRINTARIECDMLSPDKAWKKQYFDDEEGIEKWKKLTSDRTLFVRSPKGTFKTTAIFEYIEQLDKADPENRLKIAFLTYRRSLASGIEKEGKRLGFESYMNKKVRKSNGRIMGDRIIIQLESLHRLDGDFDLIILDESEPLIKQLTSPTLKENAQSIIGRFEELITHTKRIICLSADIGDLTFGVCHMYRGSGGALLIDNDYKPDTNLSYLVTNDMDIWNAKLWEDLDDGKRIAIASSSKSKAKELFKSIISEAVLRDIYPSKEEAMKKIRLYTSETSDSIKTKDFSDINEAWKDVDIVIFSPVITSGLSYNLKTFYRLYAYFCPQSDMTAEECLQMTRRIRNLESNEIICYMRTTKKLYPTELRDIQRYIEIKKNFLMFDDGKYIRHSFRDTRVTYHHDDNYFKIFLLCRRNTYLSLNNFAVRCKHIIEKSGAKAEMLIPDIPDDDEKRQEIQKKWDEIKQKLKTAKKLVDEEENHALETAPDLTQTDYEELKNKDSLEEWEKIMRLRYEICKCYSIKDPDAAFFSHYKQKPKRRRYKMREVYLSKAARKKDCRDILQERLVNSGKRYEEAKDSIEDTRAKDDIGREYYAMEILEKCGFDDFRDRKHITREKLESKFIIFKDGKATQGQAARFIIKEAENLRIHFDLCRKPTGMERWVFKRWLEFVNGLLKELLGISIKAKNTKRKEYRIFDDEVYDETNNLAFPETEEDEDGNAIRHYTKIEKEEPHWHRWSLPENHRLLNIVNMKSQTDGYLGES